MHRGQLITASCTTGWLDWIQSELWLFDDGLLTARTGFWRTLLNSVLPTMASRPPIRDFTSAQISQTILSARSNTWLNASEFVSARFHAGLGAGIVDVDTTGAPVKLLWLPRDSPEGHLRDAFLRWGVAITE